MTLRYDEDGDVLYVSFEPHVGKIKYTQNVSGDVVRYSASTGRIVGVTILFFMERCNKGETIEVPEIGGVLMSSLLESIQREKRTP